MQDPDKYYKDLAETYGGKAVGFTFNPSGNIDVTNIKEFYANMINLLNDYREGTMDGEKKCLYSIAITQAQTAQMWAVKALTWGK